MTDAAPPLVWRRDLSVRVVDVGPDERLRPTALIDLLQEEAGHHARAFGLETFALPARGGGASGVGTWVLSRLVLSVDRWPAALEPLALTTWPSAHDGLRASRDFVLRDDDGATVARASSVWVVLDVVRRRPVRLPTEVTRFGPPDGQPRALIPGDPPEAPAVDARAEPFTVRRADLDRVGHANNARFAEWALETIPEATWSAHRLTGLDLAFHREAAHGDALTSHSGPGEGGAFAHRIARGDETLALARSAWAKRTP